MLCAETSIPSRVRNLLFVDDEQRVLDSIRRSLHCVEPGWRLFFANSVEQAMNHLATEKIDAIVTDLTMPRQDGFVLMGKVVADPRLKHIPIVVLTGLADSELKRRALDAGAFDLVGKPIHREDLIARLRSVLRTRDYETSLADLNATLEQKVIDRTIALNASRTDLLLCLAMAGECRDTDTGWHLIRVAHYSQLLATAMGLGQEEIATIFKASALHDIGKLGIPDQILLKPGALTPAERIIMQGHCEAGLRILSTQDPMALAFESQVSLNNRPENPLLVAAAGIAVSHHEKWDGSGYPHGLAGNKIPLSARIVALADVYDALTSRRPYKQPFTHEVATSTIIEGIGSHFDPDVVEAFGLSAGGFNKIRTTWSDLETPGNSICDKAVAHPEARKVA